MAISPDPNRNRAEDEAASWLVRLCEKPDDTGLKARFEEWLAASDLNAEVWTRTSRAYRLIGEGPPRHQDHWKSYAAAHQTVLTQPRDPALVQAARSAVDHRCPRGARVTRRLTVGVVAATLAACLLIAVMPGLLLRWEAGFTTATAEPRLVVLEDGSQVHLAPESAIDTAFAGGERRVNLIKGAAFFDVSPDAARPFRVTTGDTVATVLGTGFEVRRSKGGGAAIAVQHGHVRVENGRFLRPVSEQLRAGEWLRVAPSDGVTRGTRPPEEIAAWRRGELVVRDQPAGEIVEALRPYYNGVILVRSDAFAARRVSGIYDLHDPVKTLQALAMSHGAKVTQISRWLMVVGAD